MHDTLAFLLREGMYVTFLLVLAEQCGLPIPAAPALLAMGALTARGQFSFAQTLALAILASLLGDLLWYWIGKKRGASVLKFLCRISIEPDSCVRKSTNIFERYGSSALLVAKFVPGLSTMAPPMAGLSGIGVFRFAASTAIGGGLWAGLFLGTGYVFSNSLEQAAETMANTGQGATAVIFGGLLIWIGYKLWQRNRFLNQIATSRITPGELNEKLTAKEPVVIFDLRHKDEIEDSGFRLPGAQWIDLKHIEQESLAEMREHFEVILYCS